MQIFFKIETLNIKTEKKNATPRPSPPPPPTHTHTHTEPLNLTAYPIPGKVVPPFFIIKITAKDVKEITNVLGSFL